MNSHERASESSFEQMVAFESGGLSDKETIELFQTLIDKGTVWSLQGSYGRMARDLINAGQCVLGPVSRTDSHGNYVPSRFDLPEGSPGTEEYAEAHSPSLVDSPEL